MNKQPFYHGGYDIKGDGKAIVKAIKSIKTVLKGTVEFYNEELLFTATSDVSEEANEKLRAIPGVANVRIEAEPGDPADLM
jgi:hypothetical protein